MGVAEYLSLLHPGRSLAVSKQPSWARARLLPFDYIKQEASSLPSFSMATNIMWRGSCSTMSR